MNINLLIFVKFNYHKPEPAPKNKKYKNPVFPAELNNLNRPIQFIR
jgi:hypothetical protein